MKADNSNSKVGTYQSLTFHLTTHRLLLVPSADSPNASPLQAPLSSVRQTEFYTGFMRSSPKITLYLGRGPVAKSASAIPELEPETGRESPAEVGSWTCGVCGFANPLPAGVTLGPESKCALCGVGWSVGRTLTPSGSKAGSEAASRTGTPAPSSIAPTPARAGTPASSARTGTPAAAPKEEKGKQVACPACTFLNHPSMSQCEICGTPLRKRTTSTTNGAAEGGDSMEKHDVVRLSFRKGGAADAYKRLKGVLGDKAWERAPLSTVTKDGDKSGAGIGTSPRSWETRRAKADIQTRSCATSHSQRDRLTGMFSLPSATSRS